MHLQGAMLHISGLFIHKKIYAHKISVMYSKFLYFCIINYLLYDDLSRSSLLNLPISKDSFGIIYECCKLLVHVATLRQRQTLCTYVLIDVRAKFIPCPVKSKFAKTYLVIYVLY